MKAAVYTGSKLLEVRDVADPVIGGEEILIRIAATGICGSDLYHISGKNPRISPPVILGHEFTGTVISIGEGVPEGLFSLRDVVTVDPVIKCGVCEYCLSGQENLCRNFRLTGHQRDGGYAELVGVHWSQVIKLPESIGLEFGHLVEPVAVAVHGLSLVPVETAGSVVVMGAGPIGFITAQVARALGAGTVVLTDVIEERLKLAERYGFLSVNAASGSWKEQLRANLAAGEADLVIDAAGTRDTALVMPEFCKPGGHLLIIAMQKGFPEVNLQDIGLFEKHLESSRLYLRKDFLRAVRLIESGKIDLSELIKDRFPLTDINEAMNMLRDKRSLKPVIDMRM